MVVYQKYEIGAYECHGEIHMVTHKKKMLASCGLNDRKLLLLFQLSVTSGEGRLWQDEHFSYLPLPPTNDQLRTDFVSAVDLNLN